MAVHYRALFISDVHLGMQWSQAGKLLAFLQEVRTDTLYLVGDIVDFWRIKRGLCWTEFHGAVLNEILAIAHSGTRVVFIPGNHDDNLRAYCGARLGNIEIHQHAVHVTAAGDRYLVTHGDEYDVVSRRATWLAHIGDRGYAAALAFNRPFNAVRKLLGMEYWSISAYLKHWVKERVGRASKFEGKLIQAAMMHKTSGVICGHIHHAASHYVGGIHYVNTGDWVESCTAVGETVAGKLELIEYPLKGRLGSPVAQREPDIGAVA